MRVRAVVRLTVALQAFLLIAMLLLPALAYAEEPVDPSTPPTPTEQPSDPPPVDPTSEPSTPDPTAPTEPVAAPQIVSDLEDYPPGGLVTLTGTNWAPGESVHLYVNDEIGSTWTRQVDVTADSSGNISDQFNLPDWFVANYVVVATGQTSGVALTTFTDSSPASATIEVRNAGCVSAQNVFSSGNTVCVRASVLVSSTGNQPYRTQWFSPTAGATPTFEDTHILGAAGPITFDDSHVVNIAGTWTVKGCGSASCNGSNLLDTETFTVNAPADTTVSQPTLLSPANGATTSDTTPTFDWTGVSDPSTPVTYRMQYVAKGATCDFTSATTTGVLATSTFTPGASIGSDGPYCWRAKALDGLGNDSGYTVPFEFTLDTTKPIITATATNADATAYVAGTWTNQSVTVTFSCADTGGSGLASNTVGGGGTQSAETATGSFTNTGACTDNAGNTADSVTFSPIMIDMTAPVITATATNADASAYVAGTWTNQGVTVTFTCADTGAVQSGIATNTVSGDDQTLTAETIGTNVSSDGQCVDAAGNSDASETFGPVMIDKTAPVISGVAAPAPNANGWNIGSVSVMFTCADTGAVQSGIATNTVSGDDLTLTAETSGTNVTSDGQCVDAAGNADTFASIGPVKIDLTDPSVAITVPTTSHVTVMPHVVVSGTQSDTPSGIDKVVVNGVTALLGAGTFTAIVPVNCGANTISALATDLAGRTSTSSSILVNRVCAGSLQYYQPIDQSTSSTPVVNTGKFGRVIPVKVTGTLSLGETPVLMTESFLAANGLTLRIGVNGATCGSGAASDSVEAYADAGASNENTNQFRWSTSHWIYNLDTGKAPSVQMQIGSCYRLDVRLVDAQGASILLSSGPGTGAPYAVFKPVR